MLIPPAVGEALAETGARHLPARLSPEAATGVAGACRRCPLEILEFCGQIGADGLRQSREQPHRRVPCSRSVFRDREPASERQSISGMSQAGVTGGE